MKTAFVKAVQQGQEIEQQLELVSSCVCPITQQPVTLPVPEPHIEKEILCT
jgi:hypothetical protein